MVASILSAIQTQLVTDIETTSIDKCSIGASMNTTKTPRAELTIGGGELQHVMTQVLDRMFPINIRVYGKSMEAVEYAIEEIQKLWFDASKRAALRALGVINIMPDAEYPPVVFNQPTSTGRTTQNPVYGDIQFTLHVRYTI